MRWPTNGRPSAPPSAVRSPSRPAAGSSWAAPNLSTRTAPCCFGRRTDASNAASAATCLWRNERDPRAQTQNLRLRMILLLDIGNTNTHLGLASHVRLVKQQNIPTAAWFNRRASRLLKKFVGAKRVSGAALCSVVPRATPLAQRAVRSLWQRDALALTP